MTPGQTRRLSDTRFLTQTIKDALRPTLCPRCNGLWIRDFRGSRVTYECAGCRTRWVQACAAS